MQYGLMTSLDYERFTQAWFEEGRSPCILAYLHENREILYGAQPWFRFDEYYRYCGQNRAYITRDVIEATLFDLTKGERDDLMLYLLKAEFTLGWFRPNDAIFHSEPPTLEATGVVGEFEGALKTTMVIATAAELLKLWKTEGEQALKFHGRRVIRANAFFQGLGLPSGRVTEFVRLSGLPDA